MKTKARLALISQGPLKIRENGVNEGWTKHTPHIPVNDIVLTRHYSDSLDGLKKSE